MSTLFPDYHATDFNVLTAAFCTIIVFIMAEFSDFICHYTEHKVPVLWEIHKLHHSAQSLNPLTARRGHPLSVAYSGFSRAVLTAIPGGLFMFLHGLTLVEAAALSVVGSKVFAIATLDPLKHSHHPISLGVFDKLLISPHMHQIHHSRVQAHWDRNFGTSLSVFDWIFGTAYRPARGEAPVYGISGHSDETLRKYNTMYGAYVQPLLKSFRKLRKALGYGKPAPLRQETSP